MTDKIAVLCPSRFRPEQLKKAVDSWKANSVASDIIFGFQKDDPNLSRNIEIASDFPYMVFGDIGMAAKVNHLCGMMSSRNYAGYMVLNDDQVIQTEGWDRLIIDKLNEIEAEHGHRLWIPHWKDGIHDQKLAQGFLTDHMLRVTGSFYPAGYMRHLFVDNYYNWIGNVCNILIYMPEIYIEHRHFINGKASMDANYEQTNSQEAYIRDRQALEKWHSEHGESLIKAIMTEMINPKRKNHEEYLQTI